VQQVDITPKVNTPANIATLQSLDDVLKQVADNQADLPAAVAANQAAGSTEAEQNRKAVESLLAISVTSKASPVITPAVQLGGAQPTNTGSAAVTTTSSASSGGAKGANRGGSGKQRGDSGNAGDAGNAGNAGNTGNGGNDGNDGNNRDNRRTLSSSLRWAKRYILVGEQFADDES
jgi:hypothetical protein